MKKLPIGRHDFTSMREENFLYVDKTEEIYKLLQGDGRYFFSRPRRFGKSLTISTLEAIFRGRADLFEDLWIFDKIDWKTYPILRFSFDQITEVGADISELLGRLLHRMAKEHGIKLSESAKIKELCTELIGQLAKKKGKVVILIDEYDKPMLDFLPHHTEIASHNRDVLKAFFEAIKNQDSNVHFVFVTGVSKFAKVSLFSGPNQLYDISLLDSAATLCGYTQSELMLHFSEVFPEIARNRNVDENGILQLIKEWYNGYAWRGESVYNP